MGASLIGQPLSSRLIGKVGTVTQDVYTAVTAATGAGSYGAWVQVTASTASEILVVGVGIHVSSSLAAVEELQLRVGVGGSGSESAVATLSTGTLGASDSSVYFADMLPFFVPPRIAGGARVSVSVKDNSTRNYWVQVIYTTLANVEGS